MSRLTTIPEDWRSNLDDFPTATSLEQHTVEENVENYFLLQQELLEYNGGLQLFIKQHSSYLNNSLHKLSQSYECLDASRPWLTYWIIHSLDLLKKTIPVDVKLSVIDLLSRCQSSSGGFAGGPGQLSHLAPTYAAICTLCILNMKEAFQIVDRQKLKDFLLSLRTPEGAFRLHEDGEVDVRGVYCAAVAARLTNIASPELFKGTAEWVVKCQTYEGGIGSVPGMEAHSGYSFCGFAALILLGEEDMINCHKLLRWVAKKQMQLEGGFQGRTNKLVDGCYSFWQGGLFPLSNTILSVKGDKSVGTEEWLFDDIALQEYILVCCQHPKGGFFDKPGKFRDLYHTCYCLSGLSIAQHVGTTYRRHHIVGNAENELLPTHPVYNINPSHVTDALEYYNSLPPL